MRLELLAPEFSITRLDPSAPVPDAVRGEFVSITRTRDELSIVAPGEGGFRCFKVEGPLDFSLVGILASLSATLARAEVPIFAISTFDTDYILIAQPHLDRAIAALERDGHTVQLIS